MQMKVEENTEEIGKCGCGRSPTGKCIGWHAMTEDEWLAGKVQLLHSFKAGQFERDEKKDDDEMV